MCEYRRLDEFTNEVITKQIGIAPMENEMRETRLRWFSHVTRIS